MPLQITLRNPPVRRRLLNGSNTSNTPSPTISPSECFSPSSQSSSLNDTPQTPDPPPIPPRSSLIHTTSKHHEVQFDPSNQTSVKAGLNTTRSRNLRQNKSTNTRSDSADAHSILSSRNHQRQLSNEQGANSD